MQKDRHNIYSKEELLKLIKERKSAPADMDEFDLEALEGLKMLDNHDVLTTLNKDIDKIVLAETKKEKQRKTIYYFSAAASLLLLVGLVFFFKNSDVIQNEKVVASAEPKQKKDNLQETLNAPIQEETPETYENREPEPAKPITTKSEKIVLAENKTKQKNERDNNADVVEEERSYGTKKQDATLSDAQSSLNDADAKSIGSVDKETFQQQASKDVNTVISTQAGVIANDENRAEGSVKSKKIVEASSSQPSMAYQKKDQASFVEQSPAAPANAKKEGEKTKSDLSYADSFAKNKTAKNYKEPAFTNGDSTFATYVKQNLKISSTTNSGIIVVEFLVDKNGKATNIEILKSLNNCDVCSKDVIDFIKSIKKWKPAIRNGKTISAPKKISIQYN